MAGWISTVPDAMDALVALWSAAVDTSQVLVADGPAVGGDGQLMSVYVGWDGNDGSVLVENSIADAGLVSNREKYTVFCSVNVADGGTDNSWSPLRNQAKDLYGQLSAALSTDSTLDGLVLSAVPGSTAWHQVTTQAGRLVIIAFGVQVDAFTKEAA